VDFCYLKERLSFYSVRYVLAVLRLMGKYIGHRLVARPELAHTFWTDNTSLCCRPALYSEALWYTGMENQPTKFTVYQVLTVSVEKCLDDFFLQNGGGCQKLRGTLE